MGDTRIVFLPFAEFVSHFPVSLLSPGVMVLFEFLLSDDSLTYIGPHVFIDVRQGIVYLFA